VNGLLEVIARHPADAERAEEGGADRIELVGSMDYDGLSPEPALVGQVRRATTLPIRVMVRLRDGFGTDGGEVVRLRGLAEEYLMLGADGLVLGFLNAHTEIDVDVVLSIVGEQPGHGWTFHRAVDSCISTDRAWRTLPQLPGLDQVLTAGSARSVTEGLDDLVARATADPFARRMIMAGGGLSPEHVPWLARAGVRAYHLGRSVRPDRSWKAYVDAGLVRSWRKLVNDSVPPEPSA
jgi:copper homeostasis protein